MGRLLLVRNHVATLRSSGSKTRLASRRTNRFRSCSASAPRRALLAPHTFRVPKYKLGTPSKAHRQALPQPIRAYMQGIAPYRSNAAHGLLLLVRGLSPSWFLTRRSFGRATRAAQLCVVRLIRRTRKRHPVRRVAVHVRPYPRAIAVVRGLLPVAISVPHAAPNQKHNSSVAWRGCECLPSHAAYSCSAA